MLLLLLLVLRLARWGESGSRAQVFLELELEFVLVVREKSASHLRFWKWTCALFLCCY